MDAIEMLGGQTPVQAPSLRGLTPEEIKGVSAGRIGREQMMGQMLQLLSGQKGREAVTALNKEKLKQLQKPAQMVTLTDDAGVSYEVLRENITQGINAVNNVNKHLLTKSQAAKMDEEIPMEYEGKTYNVKQGHMAGIAGAIKEQEWQDMRMDALTAIEGKSPEELMTKEHFANFSRANPQAATAAVNSRLKKDKSGLSEREFQSLSDLNTELIHAVLQKPGSDQSLLDTINDNCRRMDTNFMLLEVPGLLPYTSKSVTVPIPPELTIKEVYEIAKYRKVPVTTIIQELYDSAKRERNE